MENERSVNRFWSLKVTGPFLRLEEVIDSEEWFHGSSRNWARYGESSFANMSILDRFLILRGIYNQGDFADRTRRQVLRYYDECKTILSELVVGDPMYESFWQITNDVFNTIYVPVFIGIGVNPSTFVGGEVIKTGFVWSPEYFGNEIHKKQIDKRSLYALLLCVYKRYTHVKGFSELCQDQLIDLCKVGPTLKRWVYRKGLDLGETPGGMLCSKFKESYKESEIR